MKKLVIPLLAAGFASASFADTGYTIYGRVNVSVESQKVGPLRDAVLVDNSSRLGFRGNRDLPNGMYVGFVLEAGTNLTSGSHGSKFFAREATANIGGAFGKVRLGRMPASEAYFATADYVSNHNHDTGTSADALYDFFATGQLSNAIAYTTPKFASGAQFDAQYGLKRGTGTGVSDFNDVHPIALAYNQAFGPIAVGVGYERAKNPFTSPTDTAAAHQVAARVYYSAGPFGVGGYVQRSGGTNARRNAYRLSGMYTMGPSEFHLNFGAAGNRAGFANTGANQVTLGYNYNIDKATKVYAFYTRVNNKSAANYNPGSYSRGNATGEDLSSLAVGLRYNF